MVSYLSCQVCLKGRLKLLGKQEEDFRVVNYTSGESDSEFIAPFNDLDTDEKSRRLKFLWLKAFGRARGAVLLVEKLRYLKKKILLMGRMPDAAEIKLKEEQAELESKDAKFVIFPDNKYKQRWDIFIAILLVLTAVYVPLRVSFFDETTIQSLIVDSLFDLCFILDIILTFFTSI